jgi:hypothetical protein
MHQSLVERGQLWDPSPGDLRDRLGNETAVNLVSPAVGENVRGKYCCQAQTMSKMLVGLKEPRRKALRPSVFRDEDPMGEEITG